jgi:hypothetical protein
MKRLHSIARHCKKLLLHIFVEKYYLCRLRIVRTQYRNKNLLKSWSVASKIFSICYAFGEHMSGYEFSLKSAIDDTGWTLLFEMDNKRFAINKHEWISSIILWRGSVQWAGFYRSIHWIPQIMFGFTFAYSDRPVDIIYFTPCKTFCSFLFFNNFVLDKNCKIKQSV